MVGPGKRMESGAGSQGAGHVGGACQPCTLPQCGVRAYRSNSSSGGNRGPGVKKFVRIWETRERPSSPASCGAGREDPGSGLRRVTVTQPLGRPTPCNAVDSIHARRSRASTWTHSGSGGAWRLRWSLGCLTLQDPARPPRWLGLPSPQSSNAGAPSGAPGHLHAFCPSPQTSGVSRL
ncbi:unnamed protein product [Nyctereutes procyonoides]|uniref:(raccoon dog) hypothetical protein n=1 Tax=Nyctereutes procyonoides TaxID=34880 RepID=A0A811YK23_NYCPR|nr:unnamed protein product [Nyctereutes procyonoides]